MAKPVNLTPTTHTTTGPPWRLTCECGFVMFARTRASVLLHQEAHLAYTEQNRERALLGQLAKHQEPR